MIVSAVILPGSENRVAKKKAACYYGAGRKKELASRQTVKLFFHIDKNSLGFSDEIKSEKRRYFYV